MRNNYLTGALAMHLSLASQLWAINAQEISGKINPNTPVKEVSLSLINSARQETVSPSANYFDVKSSDSPNQEKYILVLNITGVIVKYSDWANVGTISYMKILEQAKNDQSIAGVILKMDTGGGLVHGTPDFADYLKEFKSIKPIVAYVDGYCCSAGLWIAAGANYIISSRNADAIGSAGTYTTLVNYSKMYESLGIDLREIYADESPLKNYNTKKVFDKDNPDETPYKNNVLTPIIEKFHSYLADSRPNISEEVRNGKEYFYNAELAMENGLIDEIGTMQNAIDKVFELSEQINKSQEISMNIELNNMAKALGVDALEVKSSLNPFDKTQKISLTLEQCSILEQTLASADPEKLEALTASLQSANEAKQASETELATLKSATSTALETAGLKDLAKESATENIATLAAKVVEFGKKADTTPTNVHANGEVISHETEEQLESLSKFNVNEL